jgi:hypothetical protein
MYELEAASLFLMSNAEAILLATEQVKTVKRRWPAVCDEAISVRSIGISSGGVKVVSQGVVCFRF